MEKISSILIVDDDVGMTETLADILDDMGYDVAVAGDGYRAVERIREKVYGIVLMDIKMPGINGVETFKEVKRTSPSTKVIMMTAYSVEDLIKEALEGGAYGIIYKPLDIDKVMDLIEKAEKGALILVVDDDPATCETFKDVMREKGYKVGVAYSGEEAVRFATKESDIGIVFIDVKMPVLNGLETYLAIKELNPGVTAVMMTGYRQEVADLVDEALRDSAYTCLNKPLDMDNVIALVEEISRQRLSGTVSKPGSGGDDHE
jgi:two-component system response regulator HydG